MSDREPRRAGDDPIREFVELFEKAAENEPYDATAVTLATADGEARPSARTVLLKHVDERGFVFYTNFGSRKARELDANPRAALCFLWQSLKKQVRVEGTVERVDDEEADAYFASRPRGSQIGAWTSRQSETLESRATLLARYAATQARFIGRTVPRPEFWGGYRLRPEVIEFWHNELYRLHDRIVYVRRGDLWESRRLYP